jgi:hypothetical protein
VSASSIQSLHGGAIHSILRIVLLWCFVLWLTPLNARWRASGAGASSDGSMTTHTNDCIDCDFRLSVSSNPQAGF